MNRGSDARGGFLVPKPRGFNEAPIHESGKSARNAPERRARTALQ